MKVDHKSMLMLQRFVPVRVSVRLGAFPALVLMLVMPVMHVEMFMVQLLMNML